MKDRVTWCAVVHGVAKSWTQLSDRTTTTIYMSVCVLSRFNCVQLCATLWILACQAPLSMGFSRQEYWNGLPCPPSGDLADLRIKPASLLSNLHWQLGLYPWCHLGVYVHMCMSVNVCVYIYKIMHIHNYKIHMCVYVCVYVSARAL